MKKVVFFIMILAISSQLVYAASFTNTKNDTLGIVVSTSSTTVQYGTNLDFSKADQGIVSLFYYSTSTKKMKLIITLGEEKYTYNVFSGKEIVNYPLQLGNGTYNVSLYENTSGTKYRKVLSQSKYVEMKDENSVYLQSILEVNWDEEDESIEIVDEILAEALVEKKSSVAKYRQANTRLTEKDIVLAIYNFVIETVEYDYDKIKTLDYSYLPDNDRTLEMKTGICYDYSSLLASMLRSQGIPTKMVKGYAKDSTTYHAWNEIYLSSEKKWVVVDPTLDAYLVQNGKKYSFEQDAADYNKVKEF